MKRVVLSLMSLLFSVTLIAQDNKSDVLQNLEKDNKDQDVQNQTATLKSASRLFGTKGDLSSVIMVLPSGSSVSILGSDSSYYKVSYNDDQGYIFKKDAVVDETPVTNLRPVEQADKKLDQQSQAVQDNPPNDQSSRMSYLENKYGTSMATLLFARKIWKGMTSDMVRDSWGSPGKINKTYEGNLVKEEWLYKNTWLYIENDILSDWGAIRK